MRFPLVDWINAHPACRHDLARSGVLGTVRRPRVSASEIAGADAEELRRELAGRHGVPPERLFLTHGATEGNALVLFFVARHAAQRRPTARVLYPEYPPLFDGARGAGFRVVDDRRPASLALLSNPRNPEGVEVGSRGVVAWADGAAALLVDETFRDFGDRPSLARLGRPGVWVTGTFTKYYAGDDLRVGFVIAPAESVEAFEEFVGLYTELLTPAAVAGALSVLRRGAAFRRAVDRLVAANRAALHARFPGATSPVAPVWFDRPGTADTRAFAERLAARSILVCPGVYFGDPTGVRLCLTRRSFPEDLAAYAAHRPGAGRPRATATGSRPPARRRRAAPGRARSVPA